MKKIIAAMGDAGSGKSLFATVAALCGFQRIEMGCYLKKMETGLYHIHEASLTKNCMLSSDIMAELKLAREVYGLTEDQVADVTEQFLWYVEENEPYIHNGLRRNYLQYLGTEIMRETLGQDCHIKAILNHIDNSAEDKWIVESVRFVNEIESLRESAGGSILDKGKFGLYVIKRDSREELKPDAAKHPSEVQWKKWLEVPANSRIAFDIINDGTKAQFVKQSADMIQIYESLVD